jgi:hypothetical protein
MHQWFLHHQISVTLGAWFIFSSAVSALPEPDASSSKGYRFLFSFCHLLSGNLLRIPALKNLVEQGQDATASKS